MANITIVKLKVRRGSDAQRKEIVLDQGEVGYTLDSKRLFVGDGSTYGGKVAGNVNVGPFNTAASLGPAVSESPYLQIGDIGYADSKLYILTGAAATGREYTNTLSGWGYIGNVPDDVFLGFDTNNKLTIKKHKIDAEYLGTTFFGEGLLSSKSATNVALNADYLALSGAPGGDQRITPKVASLGGREIASTALSSGLQGGNPTSSPTDTGQPISLNVNESQFTFDANNKLELQNIGTVSLAISSWAGPGDGIGNLGSLGGGLRVNTGTRKLEADLQSVDTDVLRVTDGEVTLNGAISAFMEMPFLDTNKGLITEIKSSIFDVITATGLSGTGAGDGVPIGSILPHAQAFTIPPAGYLLCNGHALDAATNTRYRKLYDKIGTVYGGTNMTDFQVPNLTGGDVLLYGANGAITTSTRTLYLSATDATPNGLQANNLSAFGVNFIIKYAEDPVLNIFNGAPNQVERQFGGKYTQQVCYGKDSSANAVTLSSAGFITMALSGNVRSPGSDETFDRFAIPVYSY